MSIQDFGSLFIFFFFFFFGGGGGGGVGGNIINLDDVFNITILWSF